MNKIEVVFMKRVLCVGLNSEIRSRIDNSYGEHRLIAYFVTIKSNSLSIVSVGLTIGPTCINLYYGLMNWSHQHSAKFLTV